MAPRFTRSVPKCPKPNPKQTLNPTPQFEGLGCGNLETG